LFGLSHVGLNHGLSHAACFFKKKDRWFKPVTVFSGKLEPKRKKCEINATIFQTEATFLSDYSYSVLFASF
jgi:hypothetical protein